MALVYTHNTWDEKELVTIITFKITEKRQKFPGINLTKDMEGLYQENFNSVKKQKNILKNREKI